MTRYQATVLAFRLAALSAAGSGVWAWAREGWVPAVCMGWGAIVLLLIGGRCRRAHLSIRAIHERARRAARTDPVALATPVPCCSFWRHTDGEVHGPDCPRLAAARHDDYRLDPDTAAAFEEVTAHFDDATPHDTC